MASLPPCGRRRAGRSLLSLMRQMGRGDEVHCFYESPSHFVSRELMGLPVRLLDAFDPEKEALFLALGTGAERAALRKQLPAQTQYGTCVHPQAFFLEPLEIPEGCVIYPMTYFSRNITLGAHALIMPNCVIGHDVSLGQDFTTSASVNIGGGARLGERVFCGLNASLRDHIQVCNDVYLGMSSTVTKDITQPGRYMGTPARLLS